MLGAMLLAINRAYMWKGIDLAAVHAHRRCIVIPLRQYVDDVKDSN